jgi:membrane protein implicated in regulation of membrane protease activity
MSATTIISFLLCSAMAGLLCLVVSVTLSAGWAFNVGMVAGSALAHVVIWRMRRDDLNR